MGEKELKNFFVGYLSKSSIFKDKKALQSNYTPKTVPYRDEQIENLASVLAPSLRMEKPEVVKLYV